MKVNLPKKLKQCWFCSYLFCINYFQMKIKKIRTEMYYIFLSCLFCQKNYGIRAVIHKDFDALFCNTCFSNKITTFQK